MRYTDEHIKEIRNCMTSDSIIGIDRTINLGPYFLTSLVYQHFNLVLEHFGHTGGKYRYDKLIPTLKENNISPESVKSHNSA
jgi:hypothetical protein